MDALATSGREQDYADGGIMINVVQIGRQLLGYEPGLYSYGFLRKMAAACSGNCSGHGQCLNGSCYCMIQYQGAECDDANFSFHVAFSSIFSLMALTSLIQLGMCIHSEYLRQKSPSLLRSFRVTTQKMLYFLTFIAATLRAIYFASPKLESSLSASLMSAFYPVLLSGSSLVVCFWAEIFHLQSIRWDRPRFLSKSFLGFLTFNFITYSLFIAEFILLWTENENHEFYTHIFNGCYAGLMFVVVVFFLIYGVEVFFKVRGGFTIQNVPKIINSRRTPVRRSKAGSNLGEDEIVSEEQRPMVRPKLCGMVHSQGEELGTPGPSGGHVTIHHTINQSQLHQSRLGLLSQALMMMITVGFLLSETLSQFWKPKVDLTSQNTHVIIFRVVEIGVALWFPCVLWNCIRPEQLWILTPKKIIKTGSPGAERDASEDKASSRDSSASRSDDLECWICYDSDNSAAGSLIQPCGCKGDVGYVHHDCLRRWLVEKGDENPDNLTCGVCKMPYEVERDASQFSLAQGFTPVHWVVTASTVFVMMSAAGGCWAAIQIYSEAWIRMVAVGLALLIQYICLRFLGLNTVTAYQRAKVYGLKIMNKSLHRRTVSTVSEGVTRGRGLEDQQSEL